MYFILHFFGKISSYLKNPYSLTKVKTRDSGSLEMNMVGFVVVWLVGLLVVSLALEIHGYTSSEHYKSYISVYSTCDVHVEAPCLLSSNKLGKNISGYILCSLWRTVQRFQDLSHARQHFIEQLAVCESHSGCWCPVCDICPSKCPCHCFH